MSRTRWLTAPAIIAIQEELIARYGGLPGMRAPGLLESAIARPKNLATSKRRTTIPELAAACAWGLLRNHPFTDGNKRVTLAAMVVFLELNDWELQCGEAEETVMILRAAASEVSERAWADWVKRNAVRQN